MLDCMKSSSSSSSNNNNNNNNKNPPASREQMSCDLSRREPRLDRIIINNHNHIIHSSSIKNSSNNNATHKLSLNQVFDVPKRLEEAVVGGVDMDAELLVVQVAARAEVDLCQLIGNKWQRPLPSLERHPSTQQMWMDRPGWHNDAPNSSCKNKSIEDFWKNNSWKTKKESVYAARVRWKRSR